MVETSPEKPQIETPSENCSWKSAQGGEIGRARNVGLPPTGGVHSPEGAEAEAQHQVQGTDIKVTSENTPEA